MLPGAVVSSENLHLTHGSSDRAVPPKLHTLCSLRNASRYRCTNNEAVIWSLWRVIWKILQMSVRVESVRLNVDDVDWGWHRIWRHSGSDSLWFWNSDVCGLVSAIPKAKRACHALQCGRTADSLPRKNWEKRKKQTATPLNDLAWRLGWTRTSWKKSIFHHQIRHNFFDRL